MIPLWIIGAGGHAKVVIDAARTSRSYIVEGCLDDRPATHGTTVLGIPVVGSLSEEMRTSHNIRHAIIAIGSNSVREEIAARFNGHITWEYVLHPFSSTSQTTSIGEGTIVCAGVIVQADASIGRHTILNTSSSVDHDSQVGDFVHVGPGAHLAGDVVVGDGVLLGSGSSVIPGVRIGRWATVGAGAAVIEDVPDHATVVGVPARVVKIGEVPV